MVLFNHSTREMTAKIVYYGPGLCGKTTNLLRIFDRLDPSRRGKMLSLATKSDRTLFFDLLPVNIGNIGKFNLKIQLYTVPGQVFYNETRKLVLKGADAVVFVADSQASMTPSNQESFANLMENMRENQIDPEDTPIIIQYNKRDLLGVLPVDMLADQLGVTGFPAVEASAVNGTGVMETFELVSKITAKHLVRKLQGKESDNATLGRSDSPSPQPEGDWSIHDPKPDANSESPFAASLESLPDAEERDSDHPGEDADPFGQPQQVDPEEDLDRRYDHVEPVDLASLVASSEAPAESDPSPPDLGDPPATEEMPANPEDSAESTDPLLAQEVASFMAMRETREAGDEESPRDRVRQELNSLRSEIESLRTDQVELAETVTRALRELADAIDPKLRNN